MLGSWAKMGGRLAKFRKVDKDGCVCGRWVGGWVGGAFGLESEADLTMVCEIIPMTVTPPRRVRASLQVSQSSGSSPSVSQGAVSYGYLEPQIGHNIGLQAPISMR